MKISENENRFTYLTFIIGTRSSFYTCNLYQAKEHDYYRRKDRNLDMPSLKMV